MLCHGVQKLKRLIKETSDEVKRFADLFHDFLSTESEDWEVCVCDARTLMGSIVIYRREIETLTALLVLIRRWQRNGDRSCQTPSSTTFKSKSVPWTLKHRLQSARVRCFGIAMVLMY
jgi:hypothetical protein